MAFHSFFQDIQLLSPFLHRVLNRSTVIPFTELTIGPADEEQEKTYTEFEDIIATWTVTWTIGPADEEQEMLEKNFFFLFYPLFYCDNQTIRPLSESYYAGTI